MFSLQKVLLLVLFIELQYYTRLSNILSIFFFDNCQRTVIQAF